MISSQAEDALFIERAQKGDRQAFDALVRKYEKRAYQYAFRLTSNPDEACDVVADSFVRIFNALHHFRGNSAFSTWLYRIITNCFLDARKKDKGRNAVSIDSTVATDDGDIERQIEDDDPTPDLIAERNEREERVEKALTHLPEYQRAMIVMYHAEMLSYEEIAEALDLPIGTVKSRLNRARLSMREVLTRDEELFRIQ